MANQYLSYFSSFLSIIERTINNFTLKDDVLPVSSTSDREKCKDINLDSVNLAALGRPINPYKIVTYIISDDIV
jgi:hypothetical protein